MSSSRLAADNAADGRVTHRVDDPRHPFCPSCCSRHTDSDRPTAISYTQKSVVEVAAVSEDACDSRQDADDSGRGQRLQQLNLDC